MKKKGYSVLEITIVSTLGIILLIILSRWVGQLGNISLDQATTQNEINAKISIDAFREDMISLSKCSILSSEVKSITNNEIIFDIYKNNKFYKVRWLVDPADFSLYRFEQEYLDNCSTTGNEKKRFIVSDLVSGTSSNPFFIPNFLNEITDNEKYGTCENPTILRCNIKSISINLIIDEYSQQYAYHETFFINYN